ncbi:hypothetical protein PR048_030921 [Dryococelus australis]|uniref:Uncharacterized protein n=1 Tax=Dryococelus australis TaxID=614101 RepID=A0ABQ9GAC8_9NEOP|nr:hypothetical protein PR048_030921 [Dryococelus australis]
MKPLGGAFSDFYCGRKWRTLTKPSNLERRRRRSAGSTPGDAMSTVSSGGHTYKSQPECSRQRAGQFRQQSNVPLPDSGWFINNHVHVVHADLH